MKPAGDRVVREAMAAVEDYVEKPKPANAKANLNAQLQQYVGACKESAEEIKNKRDALKHVGKHLRSLSGGAFDVALYGSSAMGLSSRGSDLDLHVVHADTGEHTGDGVPIVEMLYKLVQAGDLRPLLPRGRSQLRAKIPLVCMRFKGLEVDLVNSTQSAAKALLVRTYIQAAPRLRSLITVVKGWAKARGLVDASRGMLNTYSVVLMVIHYMQAQHGLPVLQPSSPLAPLAHRYVATHSLIADFFPPAAVVSVDGPAPTTQAEADAMRPADVPAHVDCVIEAGGLRVGPNSRVGFATLPPALRDEVLLAPPPSQASMSMDALVKGFFAYYAAFDFASYAISVRCGHLLFAEHLRTPSATHAAFTNPSSILIEDPFSPTDNTARALKDEFFASVVLELRRASRMLADDGAWEAVAEPIEDSLRAFKALMDADVSTHVASARARAARLLTWEGDATKAWHRINRMREGLKAAVPQCQVDVLTQGLAGIAVTEYD
jgi:DNA polymerase sigma